MAYESKRAEFRNYLDRSGAYGALLRALKFLNKEDPKPENLIYYVRNKLCETCPKDEKYDAMADEVDRLNSESLRLERDLFVLQDKIRTPEEIQELCLNGLKETRIKKDDPCEYWTEFLTEEVIEELKDVYTSPPAKSTLFDCVEGGFRRHESEIGVVAPDPECFGLFGTLFEPLIRKSYGYKPDDIMYPYENDCGDISQIPNIDPENLYITESFIMVSRNLFDIPFAPKMTESQLKEVEETILKVTTKLKEQYNGRYINLENLNVRELALLCARGQCFKANDERLKAGKCYRFWPTGRGVYSNFGENFAVFINWIDHLRVKAYTNNGDLGKIYYNLLDAFHVFESNLFFARHETYGYLSPDLCNLGSSIKAGATLNLPYVSQLDKEQMENILRYMGLKLKKLNKDKQILMVELAPSIDRNEYAQMKTLANALEFLIKCEKEKKVCGDPPRPVEVQHKPLGGGEGEGAGGGVEATEGEVEPENVG